MTTLVAYYSRKGHTQNVATALAGELAAETVRIEPAGRVNLAFGAMEAMPAMKSPIKPCRTDLAGVDTLVIATPVWAGKVPPFVSMYLSLVTHGEGKPFHVITERGSSHGSDAPIRLVRHKLEEKGMRFVSSLVTFEHEVESGGYHDKVKQFAGQSGISYPGNVPEKVQG